MERGATGLRRHGLLQDSHISIVAIGDNLRGLIQHSFLGRLFVDHRTSECVTLLYAFLKRLFVGAATFGRNG